MTDLTLVERVERFERTVAACLCAIPLLFAAQCIAVAAVCPVFQAMLSDFGSKLPVLTAIAVRFWPDWIALAVGTLVAAVVVARRANAVFAVYFSTAGGLFLFIVAQVLTAAVMLPILQLGEVVGGTK